MYVKCRGQKLNWGQTFIQALGHWLSASSSVNDLCIFAQVIHWWRNICILTLFLPEQKKDTLSWNQHLKSTHKIHRILLVSTYCRIVKQLSHIGLSASRYKGSVLFEFEGCKSSRKKHMYPHMSHIGLCVTRYREGYRYKVSCFPPKSFVVVNYEPFHQKHYIVFVKICPPTGQITFWISPLQGQKIKLS